MSNEQQALLKQLIKTCETGKHLSLRQAAERLDCTVWYLRQHLNLFPNAWRLGGTEIRIPVADIEAAQEQSKIHRKKEAACL